MPSAARALFDLAGKTAVVTGGSRGLGRQMAAALAGAGAAVVLLGRDGNAVEAAADELRGAGATAKAFAADVTDRAALEAVARRVQEQFGRVDILVNAAGVQLRKPSLEFAEADWRFVLDVNLTGTFFACQVFGRGMVERRSGKIVNIGSLTSRIGLPGRVAYTASKGGVLLLTRTLAVEWAKYHVNVNAIGPGYFRTEMNTALFDDAAWVEGVMRHIPMKREGLPPDLDGTVIYLCSAASDYLTGQILYVDGGFLAGVEL